MTRYPRNNLFVKILPFFITLIVQTITAAESNQGNVTDERVINSPSDEPGSWLTYGQNFKEQRFSQTKFSAVIGITNLQKNGHFGSLRNMTRLMQAQQRA